MDPWLGFARNPRLMELVHVGSSQNWGYLFGGPHNKDYSILGSILGSPYLGKLPCKSKCSSSKVVFVYLQKRSFMRLASPHYMCCISTLGDRFS